LDPPHWVQSPPALGLYPKQNAPTPTPGKLSKTSRTSLEWEIDLGEVSQITLQFLAQVLMNVKILDRISWSFGIGKIKATQIICIKISCTKEIHYLCVLIMLLVNTTILD
jgi:hypothetical protein